MRRGEALRALGVLALALLGACGGSMGKNAQSADGGDLVGAPAPEFSLTPIEGGAPIGPKSFGGKVVILDFWATWCAPCRDSFPAYQRMVDKFGGELVVVGISVDDDPKGIAGFRSATGTKFPLVWDEGQVAAGAYKPGTMPTSFMLDKNGIVQFIHQGFRTGDATAIEEHVQSLLEIETAKPAHQFNFARHKVAMGSRPTAFDQLAHNVRYLVTSRPEVGPGPHRPTRLPPHRPTQQPT